MLLHSGSRQAALYGASHSSKFPISNDLEWDSQDFVQLGKQDNDSKCCSEDDTSIGDVQDKTQVFVVGRKSRGGRPEHRVNH